MDLTWGTGVASTDLWVGSLDGAVVALDTSSVTHFVVRRGLLFGRRYTVPAERVTRWDPEGIHLDLGVSEVLGLPRPRDADSGPAGVLLGPRTRVLLADDTGLRLRGVRVSPEGPTLTHLLVGRSGPFRPRILLPLDAVAEFSSTQTTCGLTRPELERLPTHRPDRDIENDVWEALHASDEVSDVDLKGVTVALLDGLVTLEGNVRTSVAAHATERLAGAVEGVGGLSNHLFSDWDIDLAVASYMSREAPRLSENLAVHTQLGMVHLEGRVSFPDQRDALIRGIRQIPGVQGVEDLVEMRSAVPVATEELPPAEAATLDGGAEGPGNAS